MSGQRATDSIKRRARIFGPIAGFAAVLAVICVFSQMMIALAPLWRGGDQAEALRNGAVQAILAVPALLYVFGLGRARRVFRRIGAGEVFTRDNSRGFALIGWFLFGGALWSLAAAGLQPTEVDLLALQLNQVAVGARDLALLALGLALVVIGQAMAQATALKTENDAFF